MRPTGSSPAYPCSDSALPPVARSTIGVRMTPGHTALTRTPDWVMSSVAVRVRPTMPCLLARILRSNPALISSRPTS
jgi:hypothetical protein